LTPVAHWVWPIVQEPAQTPFTHVWFVHGIGAPKFPVLSQVSTEFPMHLLCGATHSTHAPCEHAGIVPPHVSWFDQAPVASQLCVTAPKH
jgi:hypothetical protein